jgi:Ras-related protein Rab-5C
MLGSTGVGKSSIALRMSKHIFSRNLESTVGVSFVQCTVKTDRDVVELNIWDTGGSEKYRSLAPMYYRNADFAIIVYSVDNSESLIEAEYWIKQVKLNSTCNTLIGVCANKSDLMSINPQPTTEKITELLNCGEIVFVQETSALSGHGITEMFKQVARSVEYRQNSSPYKLEMEEDNSTGSSKCC